MTDRLSLANALAAARIERPAAERIATEIFEAIHDSVATKADLQRLETKIDAAEARLDGKIDAVEAALEAKIDAVEARVEAKIDAVEATLEAKVGAVEARLEAKIDAVEGRLDASIASLRSEMALAEHRLLTRLGSLVVIVAGLLFAALRYLPPPH